MIRIDSFGIFKIFIHKQIFNFLKSSLKIDWISKIFEKVDFIYISIFNFVNKAINIIYNIKKYYASSIRFASYKFKKKLYKINNFIIYNENLWYQK